MSDDREQVARRWLQRLAFSPCEADVVDLADLIQEQRAAAAAEAESDFRKALWLGHGHPISAIYGDDGEMQCQACAPAGWDYRRMPIVQAVRAAMSAAAAEARSAVIDELRRELEVAPGCYYGDCDVAKRAAEILDRMKGGGR